MKNKVFETLTLAQECIQKVIKELYQDEEKIISITCFPYLKNTTQQILISMNLLDTSYKHWLENIKHQIKAAQIKAAVSVSSQMLEMYWQLAEEIVIKQKTANWGEAVLEQLSIDLKLSFPTIKGFSRRNLYAIRQWYLFYSTKHGIFATACGKNSVGT